VAAGAPRWRDAPIGLDPGTRIAEAAELAATSGAALIQGLALSTRAYLEAGVDPANGARRYFELNAHYLR
jgi:hypothetical protein